MRSRVSSSSRRTKRESYPFHHLAPAAASTKPNASPPRARRFAFFDIGPISKGHALVIPKCALSIPSRTIGAGDREDGR